MEFESHYTSDWQYFQNDYKYYHVFRTPGVYFYKCTPHCHFQMRGTIIVSPRSCNMVYKWGNVGGGICLNHALCMSDDDDTWRFMHDTEEICLAACCSSGQCPAVTCPTLQYELEIPAGKCCNECVM